VILTECDFESVEPLTRRLLFVGFTRASMHAEWVLSRRAAELFSRDLAGSPTK
jgi:hypothetical protein